MSVHMEIVGLDDARVGVQASDAQFSSADRAERAAEVLGDYVIHIAKGGKGAQWTLRE
jgi:hypothetical protein